MVRVTAASVLMLLSTAMLSADVKPAGVFTSHMVLQRGMKVPVWGTAAAGESVSVEFQGQKLTTQADPAGAWRVALEPLKEGEPSTLTITGKNKVELTDVLVGEVWLCSGQSNMQMALRKGLPYSWNDMGVVNAEAEIAAAKYPMIRLGSVYLQRPAEPVTDASVRWVDCNPDTVAGFSADAYFFGRELHRKLGLPGAGVPIGLLHSSCGATSIEEWISREAIAATPELKDLAASIDELDRKHMENLSEAVKAIDAWSSEAKRSLVAGKEPSPPPRWSVVHPRANRGPCDLYNGMIHPIAPFAIRGVIWHQGESNGLQGDGMLYFFKTKALVESWRKEWNQGDFPFFYVQIAPFASRYTGNQLSELREAQVAAMAIPNTGMVVTTDIGDLTYIHTPNKQDVGKRLALWALARTYGKKDLVYSGPLFKKATVEGSHIRLTFDHVGSGLTTRDGKEPTHFEVAGEDKKWQPAVARIEGDAILVSATDVPKPLAARYAWAQTAVPNLCNKEGLPASPFRTEKW